MPSGKTVSYTYDGLNRLTKYDINTARPVSVNYKYYTSSRTPGQISLQTTKIYQETVGDTGYQYTYDKLGNIQSISEELADGTYDVINIYHYDQLSQLIREIRSRISPGYIIMTREETSAPSRNMPIIPVRT